MKITVKKMSKYSNPKIYGILNKLTKSNYIFPWKI